MKTNEYEINLNYIMGCEFIKNKAIPDDLKMSALYLLKLHNKYYFVDELLKKEKVATIDELVARYPTVYVIMGEARQRENGYVPIVYNIWENINIQKDDFQYETFFAYILKNLSIFKINKFLDYQLLNYFNDNIDEFSEFLNLCIREFSKSVLAEKVVETVNDWINRKIQYGRDEIQKSKISLGKDDTGVKWTGSKVDFIKLIYALFDSNFINNGEGERTKIVKYLAPAFQVDYDVKDNDLSVSIKTSNPDRLGLMKFFETIKSSFTSYLDNL